MVDVRCGVRSANFVVDFVDVAATGVGAAADEDDGCNRYDRAKPCVGDDI